MKFKYVIKDYTDQDFSEVYNPTSNWVHYDHEEVAKAVAEEMWSSDPSDPYKFKAIVGVRDENDIEKWFNITAEASVDFYASEVKVTHSNNPSTIKSEEKK